MKKILLPIFYLLVCLLLSQLSYAASNSNCVKSAECFEFTYKGATVHSNASVTLSFSVKVNCDRDLSHVAIELPAGAKASNYSPKSGVENPTNNPFYAIKFQTGSGYKNGKTADFSYTITSVQYAAMTSLRVEAKASNTVGRVSFDPKGCSGITNPSLPGDSTTTGGDKPGDGTDCVEVSECFEFKYLGYVTNSNGTVTLSFKTTTNCGHALSYIAFQLPNGAKAKNPVNSNPAFKYTIENTTNNPFYSFKFEAASAEGYKNGASDTFSYTLTAAEFALLTTIKVQAKAAGTVGQVSFDAKGCNPTPPSCPTPVVRVAGPDSVCAFQDEPVTFMADVTGTTEPTSFVWTVPGDWEILSGQGSAAIEVQIGSESGQVSVTVANSCGTKAANLREVFVNEECVVTSPLPVELISFEAEATKSGVLLEWATATEKNNDRFEVEKSADGLSFVKIAEVKGNGTTSAKRTYSLRDAKAGRGTHYYRLKQVDFDGTSEYSQMIVVENNLAATPAGLLVAPNPANGQFTIALDNAEAAQLQILDMNGTLLHTQQLNQGARELNFNTSSLGMRSGMYLISIKSAAGSSHAKLVVR